MKLTTDQFMSIVRGFLNIGGGVLVTNGVLSGGSAATMTGVVLNIAALAWGLFVHTDAQTVKAADVVMAKDPTL